MLAFPHDFSQTQKSTFGNKNMKTPRGKSKKSQVNTKKIRLWIASQVETKEQLCARMKISRKLLWNIEKNGHKPSLKEAVKISKYSGNVITLEDLGHEL